MTSSGGYYNDQESLHVTESCFPLKQLSVFHIFWVQRDLWGETGVLCPGRCFPDPLWPPTGRITWGGLQTMGGPGLASRNSALIACGGAHTDKKRF